MATDTLDALTRHAREVDRMRRVQGRKRESLVRAARKAGRSWHEIAQALGVTPQGAHKAFRHLDEARRP